MEGYNVDEQAVQDAPVTVEDKTVVRYDAEADAWVATRQLVVEQVTRTTTRWVSEPIPGRFLAARDQAKRDLGSPVHVAGDDRDRAQDDVYRDVHEQGGHRRLEPGCPLCAESPRAAGSE